MLGPPHAKASFKVLWLHVGDGLTPIYGRAVVGKDIVRVPGTEFIPHEVITGHGYDWLDSTPGGRALLGDVPAGALKNVLR